MDHGTLYFVSHVSERVNLKPYQLQKNISESIEQAAKQKIEKRCTREGYIRPSSVIVIARSLGIQQGIHFNGEMTFDVELIADVCRPTRGDQILCCVHNMNRMGLLAKAGDNDEVHVYVSKDYHNNADFFDDPRLQEYVHVMVEVVGSKISLNDDRVMVVGKLLRILDDDLLQHQPSKGVRISGGEVTGTLFEFELGDAPCEPKSYLGYDNSIRSALKSLAEGSKGELLRCVNEVESHSPSDIHLSNCRQARSAADEFELVYPDKSFADAGPILVYSPIDRDFFKLWEIISDFNLLPSMSVKKRIVTGHIASSPGSAVECTLKWREKLSVKPEDHDMVDGAFVICSEDCTSLKDLMQKYPNIDVRSGPADALMSNDYLKKFSDNVQAAGGLDFITVDMVGEERILHGHIFAQLVAILTCQRKGGHCCIKILDVFDKITAKLVVLMGAFYGELHMTKPFVSRKSHPERFIVGKTFKGVTNKQKTDLLQSLKKWLELEPLATTEHSENNKFVRDIIGIKLTSEAIESISKFNTTHVGQHQIRALMRILDHVNNRRSKPSEAWQNHQKKLAMAWYRKYMAAHAETAES